jgi:hypothetical protein
MFLRSIGGGILWGAGTYYNNGPAGAANHPGNWNPQANGSGQWGYVILGPYNTAATASITTAVDATILASCVVATPYSTAGGTTRFG